METSIDQIKDKLQHFETAHGHKAGYVTMKSDTFRTLFETSDISAIAKAIGAEVDIRDGLPLPESAVVITAERLPWQPL